MKKNTNFKLSILTAAMCLATSLNAAEVKQQNNTLIFDELESIQYQAKIKLPDGNLKTFNVNNGNFNLTAKMLGLDSLQNGLYKYELTPKFAAGTLAKDVRKLNDADITAEFAETYKDQNTSISGVFTIVNDKLADKSLTDSSQIIANKGAYTPIDQDEPFSTRDQQILDDLIVDGSVCVGQDCVNGESFGFDTIRLKENNLRIKFQDTSNSASFPTNDWQLVANDTGNGGQNKFSIEDIDGGRTPFTIEASAPNHSLYVDDGGRVGLGTNTPVVELQVVSGDSPTLRLEQDGSSGFTPQTFDIVSNEANFFIRDVTNGSQLPFRIIPGADTDSLRIESSNNVSMKAFLGLGTQSPDAQFHIQNGGAGASGLPRILFDNTDYTNPDGGNGDWVVDLSDNGSFRITRDASGVQELQLDPAGNLTVTGTVTTATQTLPDYVFEKDYKLMKLDELKKFIETEKHLPGVPNQKQVLEDQKGQYNMTQMQMAILEKVEELTLYTLSQEEEINSLKNIIKKMESKNQ
ncbi:MAG: hypothetical protein AB8B80_14620 [Marinicellaceae bacterium]